MENIHLRLYRKGSLAQSVCFVSFNFIAGEGVKLYALHYAEEMPEYYTLYYITILNDLQIVHHQVEYL